MDRNDNLSVCSYTVTDSPKSVDSNKKNGRAKASPFFCACVHRGMMDEMDRVDGIDQVDGNRGVPP